MCVYFFVSNDKIRSFSTGVYAIILARKREIDRFLGGILKMKNEYEINNGTLAVISLEDGTSKILEDCGDYIVSCSSYDILDHSCRYFGSSYNGRKEGAKSIIGANYKLPIVIQDNLDIVFFPTMSPSDKRCIWLAVNKIKKYVSEQFNTTRIIFDNNKELVVPISYRVIENQVYRSTRLVHLLKERRTSDNSIL